MVLDYLLHGREIVVWSLAFFKCGNAEIVVMTWRFCLAGRTITVILQHFCCSQQLPIILLDDLHERVFVRFLAKVYNTCTSAGDTVSL